MLNKYRGRILSFAILSLVTVPAFASDDSEPTAVRVDSSQLYEDIFGGTDTTQATCTADCGDGTGWECSGTSVSCTDGEGCTASGGGKTITATC